MHLGIVKHVNQSNKKELHYSKHRAKQVILILGQRILTARMQLITKAEQKVGEQYWVPTRDHKEGDWDNGNEE